MAKSLTPERLIEARLTANFGIHYFPYIGEPRNPAAAIMEAMLARAGIGG